MMENVLYYLSFIYYSYYIIIVMLKHGQSDKRCGSEAGFIAMGVEARIRKASLWNEQDRVRHIYTGLEIYRNSIRAGNVSNNGTDLLRHGACRLDTKRNRAGLDRP